MRLTCRKGHPKTTSKCPTCREGWLRDNKERCAKKHKEWLANNHRRCSLVECDRKHQAKGLCALHLWRMRNFGSTAKPKRRFGSCECGLGVRGQCLPCRKKIRNAWFRRRRSKDPEKQRAAARRQRAARREHYRERDRVRRAVTRDRDAARRRAHRLLNLDAARKQTRKEYLANRKRRIEQARASVARRRAGGNKDIAKAWIAIWDAKLEIKNGGAT